MIGNPHICGGTIISYDPALILTAAHCVDAPTHPKNHTKADNPYFILYNDIDREGQKSISITDWYIHPLYNVSGSIDVKYDSAIVQLESPLRKSSKIRRVPFWPSSNLPLPSQGELIGFGYTNTEGHLAERLQTVKLDITKFDRFGKNYIEAKTNQSTIIACHGDSGGPLIVNHTVLDPVHQKPVTVPFVLGDLTRIFGARDLDATRVNCPIPSDNNSTVTEIFTNVVALLDWISEVSGISKVNLTDPFFQPAHPACRRCRGKLDGVAWDFYGDQEDDEVEAVKLKDIKELPRLNIGGVVDGAGLVGQNDSRNFQIGSISHGSFFKLDAESMAASLNPQNIHPAFFIYIYLQFIYFII